MDADESAKKLIADQLDNLKSGRAKNKLIKDVLYPFREKQKNEASLKEKIEEYQKLLTEIENYIKGLRPSIPHIYDQTVLCASYLLLGKILHTFKAIFELAKQGYSYEIAELIRSANESAFLILLFNLENNENYLKKWLDGRVVENSSAREVIAKEVEDGASKRGKSIPLNLAAMMNQVYKALSKYSHSSYVGLITEKVDVYTEDFDFNIYAGYHFTLHNMHFIDSTVGIVLICLKMLYGQLGDAETYKKLDALYNKIPTTLTPDEMADMLREFKK